jgi:hypothetical protein
LFIARLVREKAYHARGNCGKDYLRQQMNVSSRVKRLIST